MFKLFKKLFRFKEKKVEIEPNYSMYSSPRPIAPPKRVISKTARQVDSYSPTSGIDATDIIVAATIYNSMTSDDSSASSGSYDSGGSCDCGGGGD